MADSPDRFVATTELRDGQPAPEEWDPLTGDVPWISQFLARLPDADRKVAVLTTESGATETQQTTFEQVRSAWLAAEHSAGVISVLAHGDSPRPWFAVDPWAPLPTDSRPPATVRALLIDLAEGVWQIESAGWTPPTRAQFRFSPETGRAAVCWPLGDTGGPSGVERVAAAGYELLTGEAVPDGNLVWPGAGDPPQLWDVLETALTSPSTYANCYEFKRALLFGPTTPLAGPPVAESASPPTEESQSTGAGGGGQLSRRAAVGVLGLGALGLTGLFARGSDTDSSTEQSQDDGLPDASFRFIQHPNTLRVTHAGGDTIDAGNLFVRNPRISGENIYLWSDYPGYDDQTPVSEGDSILIDRKVMSMWFAEVVWQSSDGSREVVLEERKISEEEGFGEG
ncbi:hypothetical protein [Halovenus halobia]|uniref:hypothetical protein n=1 Tax=Halovenus halobia TaxID=3396622 RepID=UPI003F56D7CD